MQFHGKTWIFVAQAVVIGGFAVFSMVLGPLFLFGVINKADGTPAKEAGVALTLMSVPFTMVTALAVFNIRARRQPLVRLHPGGVEVNLIGSSSLEGIPLVPGLLRVAWVILSREGFRQQRLLAPWNMVQGAQVFGPPMARSLRIFATFFRIADAKLDQSAAIASQITLPEAAFNAPLDLVAEAINARCRHTERRDQELDEPLDIPEGCFLSDEPPEERQ